MSKLWVLRDDRVRAVIDRRVWAEKTAKPSDGKDLLGFSTLIFAVSVCIRNDKSCKSFGLRFVTINLGAHRILQVQERLRILRPIPQGGWNGQKLHPGSKIRMEWWAWSEVDWVPRLHMQRQLWVFPPFSALGYFWYVQVLATLEKELQRCAKEFGAHILVGGRCLKVQEKKQLYPNARTVFESQTHYH